MSKYLVDFRDFGSDDDELLNRIIYTVNQQYDPQSEPSSPKTESPQSESPSQSPRFGRIFNRKIDLPSFKSIIAIRKSKSESNLKKKF